MVSADGQLWADLAVAEILESETDQQLEDCQKPRFKPYQVIGHAITITSVKHRESEHGDRTYVVIGFDSDALGAGQFKIGGHAVKLPLQLAESDCLPADLILRHKQTKSGRDFWKWEIASCQI